MPTSLPAPADPLGLRALFDAVPDGVIVVEGGRIVDVGAAAAERLRLGPARLLGAELQAVIPEAVALVEALDGGASTSTTRAEIAGRPALLTAARVGVGAAILHLGRMGGPDEQVARAEFAQRLAELRALAAGIAHEVKNPLAGIRGAAQLLADGPSAEERRELVDLIQKEVHRVDRNVRLLMDLCAPSQLAPAAIDLHRLLDESVPSVAVLGARGSTIVRDFDPSIPAVEADADRLREAFANLMSNALDAAVRRIWIRTRIAPAPRLVERGHDRGLLVRIDVEDDGPGIQAQALPALFMPFHTTKAEGHGLGLFVARRAVDDHGGALIAEGRPGVGARFSILLRERLPAPGPRV